MFRRISCLALLALPVAACSDLTSTGDRQPTTLRVNPTTFLVTEGEIIDPAVQVLDQRGTPFDRFPTWAAPVWTSSDPERLAPEGDRLRAVGPGETRATVSLAGLSAEAVIRVNPKELAAGVQAVYLTQSTQRLDASVPLIAGRPAFLRVFVTSDRPNFMTSGVRVTLYNGGQKVQELNLTQLAEIIPTSVDEAFLSRSWNAPIPADLVRPGLSLTVDVDPAGVLPLVAQSQRRFPATGTWPVNVQTVRPFKMVMIPIVQPISAGPPNLHAGNLGEYTTELLSMFPIGAHEITLRETYYSGNAASDGDGWVRLVEEIMALRVAEGSDAYYYGVLTPPPGTGIAGIGYVGWPASLGFDRLPEAAGTLAHEIGHNMGRRHSPCGNPAGVDAGYPYPNATLGAFGFDVERSTLISPTEHRDLMSYCRPRWISDYTFQGALQFRRHTEAERTRPEGDAEPALLVWGGVHNGRLTLQPAFAMDMRIQEPRGGGAYRVEGFDAAGARLFSYAFDPFELDHAPQSRQFAFAIPARIAQPERLERIRLSGPEGMAEQVRGAPAAVSPAPPRMQRLGAAGGLRTTWNASTHPMAIIRDGATGRILSIARQGEMVLPDRTGDVEVLLSDGVRTTRSRYRIQ